MTYKSVTTRTTQNVPKGQVGTNMASTFFGCGVYGAQVRNTPENHRQPPKRGEPQVDSDFVDLVMMGSRTLNPSTRSLEAKVPPVPVDQSTPYSGLLVAGGQGCGVKPCASPDRDAEIKTSMAEVAKHLEGLKHEEAEAKLAQAEKEREEQEKNQVEAFEWPGDVSGYPAECFANLRLPGCEFRAYAIYVGSPRPGLPRNEYKVPPKGRLVVFAARGANDGVEFKLAEPHSTPQEVTQASRIQFSDIHLNANFSDMDERRVIRWTQYLLDAVPGTNDSVTMWAKE
ncbi:hypothetical protein F4859DRAFT_468143 [Xylaria cf. heliscus]|nr:hypothetical protein F4859DRAFT_468143 [Xylaria cf. heliscus]